MAEQIFSIERIYLKELSLETPMQFDVAEKDWLPVVDIHLNNVIKKLQDNLQEVTLSLTITVKQQDTDEVIYIAEVEQTGVFKISGFNTKDTKRILATIAPNTLFPYIRETIDTIVLKAGFPPLLLAPINFDALLESVLQEKQEEEKAVIQ